MLYQLSYSRNFGREPLVGIEPTTARLRIECSTPELQWQHGAEGNRTLDLLNAIQALSHLSYIPEFVRSVFV